MDGGVADQSLKSLTPIHMFNNPYIHTVCALLSESAYPSGSPQPINPPVKMTDSKQKWDLLIRYLQQKGTDFIIDMCVVNADDISYLKESS